MGWGQRCAVVVSVLLIGSVALAEPAGVPGFVPIDVATNPASVVVETGDHLWKISQAQLDRLLGRRAGPDEVDPFWRSVIAANRDRLRSGDPDLIYPGEVVVLPAWPGQG